MPIKLDKKCNNNIDFIGIEIPKEEKIKYIYAVVTDIYIKLSKKILIVFCFSSLKIEKPDEILVTNLEK